MEFKKLSEKIVQNAKRYMDKYNIKERESFALLKLMEEVGELSQAVLIWQKQSRPEKFVEYDEGKKQVAQELADVIGMVITYAHMKDIDLEEALKKKWINKLDKLPNPADTESKS